MTLQRRGRHCHLSESDRQYVFANLSKLPAKAIAEDLNVNTQAVYRLKWKMRAAIDLPTRERVRRTRQQSAERR